MWERINAIITWIYELRFMRAYGRYGWARGYLLAGGIAYSALFAIAGALTIAFTAFSYTLGGNKELQQTLFETVNSSLPGILKLDGSSSGLLDPNDLIIENPINMASIISLLVLLWSAASLMTALRIAILGMYGITYLPRPFVKAKLLDLSGALMIGIGALVTVSLVTVSTQFSEIVLDWMGIPGVVGNYLIYIGTLLIALLVDTGIFMFLFSVMCGAHPPLKDLVRGSLLAGVASSILRILGTTVVSSVSENALLAPFAAIITLLIWVNLLAQVTLVASAYVANPPAPGEPTKSQLEHAEEYPNYVTQTVKRTLEWNFDPMTGVIAPSPTDDQEDLLAPPWSGIKAAWMKRKIAKVEDKVTDAQRELDAARHAYAQAAWDAYSKKSTPTTSDKLAQADPQDVGKRLAREQRDSE
ncbi:YihY/virulence factor BrkB family protein [Arcanobacterium haemolyticum]|uniref:Ribonuclease BN n=1 Tax=Arcanobacterium haemolyticum (strain ATCC 9345 / DSM 20595 / CCM 5947 / CCUG 17215 / LMG 16163 / NBRC 15585 / NCTC 8452 / 11018) TaxID=644284 RepID=D7BJZ8_ARCHD|nr:YihY/virulence factor BrkB family protein [Arcanobacterium haemolyticum]ADH92978.1 ribonuclease BN [Arcanobacterium haemolyticum DSM 20595]SQH28266.1 inner membrane protein YhjD [Arcanobacterium haemolyticum]